MNQRVLLGQQLSHHLCFGIVHEDLLGAVSFEGELLGLQPEEVQECGVVVEVIDDFFDGMMAELIGGSMRVTTFESTARHPHAEAVGIVVTSHGGSALGPGAILNHWQSAHLASPVNDGGVE